MYETGPSIDALNYKPRNLVSKRERIDSMRFFSPLNLGLTAFLLSALPTLLPAEDATRPNIILAMADDIGWRNRKKV